MRLGMLLALVTMVASLALSGCAARVTYYHPYRGEYGYGYVYAPYHHHDRDWHHHDRDDWR